MFFYYLIILMVLHFLADFVLQSDYVATNKSENVEVLAIHSLIYGFIMSVIFAHDLFILALVVILFTVSHFMVDFVSSRITKKFYIQGKRHEFFVTIGMDQLIHNLIIIGVCAYVC